MVKKYLNIVITTREIADDIFKVFNKVSRDCYIIPNCRGVTQNSGMMEFLGFSGDEKTILAFMSSGVTKRKLYNFLLKNYNKDNNGIMFELKGDRNMEVKNKLFIIISDAGMADEIMQVLKDSINVGSTVFDARGSGKNFTEFMGMSINSNKDIILSVMQKEKVGKLKKVLKEKYGDRDIVFFTTDVQDFCKLHTKKN